MFKKHKYKFLAALILFVVISGGVTVYYFKKKEATKKTDAAKEVEQPIKKPIVQPKEPLVVAPVEKPTEPSKGAVAIKKDLTLTKREQPLSKK
jgi:hypothetical protein